MLQAIFFKLNYCANFQKAKIDFYFKFRLTILAAVYGSNPRNYSFGLLQLKVRFNQFLSIFISQWQEV